MTNDDFEIALINANENNFLLQDFANELAKEVIGDILTTPFNHCDTNHDVLFDYSSDLQDKHDSFKADDTVIFAEVTAIETGIILLTVDVKKHTVKSRVLTCPVLQHILFITTQNDNFLNRSSSQL